MPSKGLMERFLTIFGDLKVYRWPMFMLYQPLGYQVKGEDIREVLESVRPGDILVRGYRDYLDGHFIPGYFSHVGLYLGALTEADRPPGSEANPSRNKPQAGFRGGKQMMIHALAEGVILEDIINFCRCDYMAVLRFPAQMQKRDPSWRALAPLDAPEQAVHDRLSAGGAVAFDEAFPAIKAAALAKLGARYDFQFDFDRFNRLSCSELVYFATKSVGSFLNIEPENRRVLGMRRSLIQPDAFVRAPLDVAWKSRSVEAAKFDPLRPA
jgi:hypothetical protein